jgi:hypothetical protein
VNSQTIKLKLKNEIYINKEDAVKLWTSIPGWNYTFDSAVFFFIGLAGWT